MISTRNDKVYAALSCIGLNYSGSATDFSSPEHALVFLLKNFPSDINGIISEIFSRLPLLNLTLSTITSDIFDGLPLAIWGGLCLKMSKISTSKKWEHEATKIQAAFLNSQIISIVRPFSLSVAMNGLDPDFAQFKVEAPLMVMPNIDHAV